MKDTPRRSIGFLRASSRALDSMRSHLIGIARSCECEGAAERAFEAAHHIESAMHQVWIARQRIEETTTSEKRKTQ